jgi:hypothetical protein
MRYNTAVLAAVAATVVIGTTGNYALGSSEQSSVFPQGKVTVVRPHLARWMTRPCATDDSVNCYWNAKLQGNSHGHSFYVRRMPGDITGLVCRFYVNHRYAANHDHCAPDGAR